MVENVENNRAAVIAEDGPLGFLKHPAPGHDPAEARISMPDGSELILPRSSLISRSDGSFFIPMTLDALELDPRVRRAIPLVREELEVGKREVETGTVTVRKQIHEHEETVDLPLTREEYDIERVPIGRPVAEAPAVRQEGDTIVVPVLEEVLHVEKRLILKEELRLTRRRTETRDPRKFTVRREDAAVERRRKGD